MEEPGLQIHPTGGRPSHIAAFGQTVDTSERAGIPGRGTESKISLDGKDQRYHRDVFAYLLAYVDAAKVLGSDGSDGSKYRRCSTGYSTGRHGGPAHCSGQRRTTPVLAL